MSYRKHYKYLLWTALNPDADIANTLQDSGRYDKLASNSVFERNSELTEQELANLHSICDNIGTLKKLDEEVKRYMRSIGFKVKKITNNECI